MLRWLIASTTDNLNRVWLILLLSIHLASVKSEEHNLCPSFKGCHCSKYRITCTRETGGGDLETIPDFTPVLNRIFAPDEKANGNSIQFINLSGNKIRKIDNICGKYLQLVELNLKSNEISDVSELSGCNSNLTHFDRIFLNQNELDDSLTLNLSMTNVTQIDLSENRFTKFPLIVAPSLRNFDFKSNRQLIEVVGSGLVYPVLDNLNLGDCGENVQQINIASFAPNLKRLHLEGTSLKLVMSRVEADESNPLGLNSLKKLNYINLRNTGLNLNNDFTKLQFGQTSLTEVCLDKNIGTDGKLEDGFAKNLPRLMRKITLSDCQLYHISSNVFTDLDVIDTLSLSYNHLEVVPPNLPHSLDKLVLAVNNITNLNESPFNDLGNVSTLDLTKNRLKALPNACFNGLHRLSDLKLSNNLIDNFPSRALINIAPTLTHLFLDNNRIESIDLNQLGEVETLTQLTTLEMHNNRIRYLPPGVFAKMSKLSHLALNHNNLPPSLITNDTSGDLLAGLANLHVLDLSDLFSTSHSDAFCDFPSNFFNLPELTDLRLLDCNQMSMINASMMPQLSSLTLSRNQIRYLDVERVGTIPHPCEVFLNQNPIECSGCVNSPFAHYKIEMEKRDLNISFNGATCSNGLPLDDGLRPCSNTSPWVVFSIIVLVLLLMMLMVCYCYKRLTEFIPYKRLSPDEELSAITLHM